MKILLSLSFSLFSMLGLAQENIHTILAEEALSIEQKVIEWRRDFHRHPELGNQEIRTAGIIADHLRKLGMDVTEHVAKTGVIAVLKGNLDGPVVALRADMDALPITERTDVAFKSTVSTQYAGSLTGVMHACGHDSHMAILMGVAEILAKHKHELKGTVKFLFQPAEEGVFGEGIEFGADLMVKERALRDPDVDVVFGLHIKSDIPAGTIAYRSGSIMAGVDQFYIDINGKQAHGAYPWQGIDPIMVASQIVIALNTIVSRNVDLTENPAVVSVGSIHGGNRHNIIPENVRMIGTIRSLSANQRTLIHERIKTIALNIGKSAGAEVNVIIENGYPVTYNDPLLTQQMLPSLQMAAGTEHTVVTNVAMGAEDFSYFANVVPGLFFKLGAMDTDKNAAEVAGHHTPDFYLNETGFIVGIKAFCNLVVDYMDMK